MPHPHVKRSRRVVDRRIEQPLREIHSGRCRRHKRRSDRASHGCARIISGKNCSSVRAIRRWGNCGASGMLPSPLVGEGWGLSLAAPEPTCGEQFAKMPQPCCGAIAAGASVRLQETLRDEPAPTRDMIPGQDDVVEADGAAPGVWNSSIRARSASVPNCLPRS